MDADKAAAQLDAIRQLMEKPVRYSAQSGIGGVWAGCMALVGLVLDSRIATHWASDQHQAMWLTMVVWAGVFLLSLAGVIFFVRRREHQRGRLFCPFLQCLGIV